MNGGGELGESVYGEKADDRPPVGDGTRGLFKAIAMWCVGIERRTERRQALRITYV